MTAAYLALQRDNAPANTGKTWNDIRIDNSPVALNDEAGVSTGWAFAYTTAPNSEFTSGASAVGTGDAAYIDEAIIMAESHAMNDATNWAAAEITNLDNSSLYDLGFTSSQGFNRKMEIRVNGGASQVLNSEGVEKGTGELKLFTDISPVSGTITVEYRTDISSDGWSYVNAGFIVEQGPPPASLTVTQTELTPGGTISGSYSNYATIPTTLTVSDGTNTITVASPTISDNGDGTGTFSGTMPSLPTTGTANLVLFGNVTVELS